jgi:hypothetical protein
LQWLDGERIVAGAMSRGVARFLGACGIVLLAVVVVAGVCLAHASPPDPTWIPGLYDDADYDDVVLALLSLDGFVATITLSPEPTSTVEPVVIPQLASGPDLSVEAAPSRAPPPPLTPA